MKLEIGKHFKFISVLVMVILAVVVMIGWNRGAGVQKSTSDRFPVQGQGQESIHPNLEPKKKPCGVCNKNNANNRRNDSFKVKPNPNAGQKFI